MMGLLALALAMASADEVVVWHTWRGVEEQGLQAAVAAWERSSGHKVTAVPLPFGAFESKAETAVPRGNGPDVLLWGHGVVGKWSTMGVIDPTEAELRDQRPVTVEALTWDGQVWGAPLAYKSLVLLYDPTRVPAPPATTDELVAMARAQTGEGRYGVAWQVAEAYYLAPFLHAFGGHAIDQEGQVQLDDAGHIGALTFLRRVAVDEHIAPPQPTAELIGRLYDEGKLTFVISGPWFVPDRSRPIAAAALPVVSETGQPARPYLTVDAAYLARGAAHRQAASELITFLSAGEGAALRASVGHQAVSLRGVVTDDPVVAALTAQADQSVPMPVHPDTGTMFESQARALRSVMRGAATPEEAAADAQRWFNILSRPAPAPSSPVPYVALAALAVLAGLAALVRSARAERKRLVAHAWDYAWVGPAALVLAALVVMPFVTGAAVSLFVHHQGDWTFVGLHNFAQILLSPDWPITRPLSFWFTLVVTLLWTVANLTLHVGLGVALALVLREPWVALKPLWRALLILPWAIPNYITALIWKAMFHAQYGAINGALGWLMGRQGPVELDWFSSFSLAFSANLATNTWLGFPFMMVVTLGALQSIPRDLEEAAEVDGATWIQRFQHVVWPLLKPALLPAVLMGSVWTFNMFNVVYLVSGGEPDGATEILISDAYRWAFSRGNRYGYASAYAVIIFGVLLVYTRLANRLAGRKIL
jgi:arabinogalactan oligomer/maltooligosaccharide transport system permease protein